MKHHENANARLQEFRKKWRKNMMKELAWYSPILIAMALLVLMPGRNWPIYLVGVAGGMSGVIVIVTKELPGAFGSLKGWSAVIVGAAMVALFWGFSILVLVSSLLHK